MADSDSENDLFSIHIASDSEDAPDQFDHSQSRNEHRYSGNLSSRIYGKLERVEEYESCSVHSPNNEEECVKPKSVRQNFSVFSPVHSASFNFATKENSEPNSLSTSPLNSLTSNKWQTLEFGLQGSLLYRMLFFSSDGLEISPWHDIPLHSSNGLVNFLCKTPSCFWAEYEVSVNEYCNPLKLKSKCKMPTHSKQNSQWNLGILPQTLLDPNLLNEEFGGLPYDGLPVEVFDISTRIVATGDVYPVKPLAAYAIVEQRSLQLSWKIIAIACHDPLAEYINDVKDVQDIFPRVLEEIRDWLRTRNCISHDDSECLFGLNERHAGKEAVIGIIAEAHSSWQLYVDEEKNVKPLNLPKERPLPVEKYEQFWLQEYLPGVSSTCIPLSNPHGSLLSKYERAWACISESMPNSSEFDSCPSMNSSIDSIESGLSGRLRRAKLMLSPKFSPKKDSSQKLADKKHACDESPFSEKLKSFRHKFVEDLDPDYSNSIDWDNAHLDFGKFCGKLCIH